MKNKAVIASTIALTLIAAAGAALASRMGVASTYIALGVSVFECLCIGAGLPLALAAASQKLIKDASEKEKE
ncbi:MAG: hypothetical protein J6M17_08570 [Ruminococcus sp.]|nr:hypothetical protein [Ruminococcus sp.]